VIERVAACGAVFFSRLRAVALFCGFLWFGVLFLGGTFAQQQQKQSPSVINQTPKQPAAKAKS